MSEEKTHEDIILCNLQAGYNFMFACPKCKDIIPFALERTTYSGFGTNDFGKNIFSCPGCHKADSCIKCAREAGMMGMYCLKCEND